ncbi:hypothetical protein [Xanthomonas nasturtii]|uniref:hypothetical protein n=1 Tax=Xanthomonas nasturtii TaxID=1843581 RepID=UPI0012901C96|nr:hypothetical protein [Xanthomonas nasturtii]WVL57695.1 hypothetical protein M3O54_005180 [Xanthomonas nasturtii]
MTGCDSNGDHAGTSAQFARQAALRWRGIACRLGVVKFGCAVAIRISGVGRHRLRASPRNGSGASRAPLQTTLCVSQLDKGFDLGSGTSIGTPQ